MFIKASRFPVLFLILSLTSRCSLEHHSNAVTTDIFILGGSEAAFTAAIQAARLGNEVVLVEPTGHVGGMLVEGLGKDIRFGSGRVIGGIAKEFYQAVESHYGLEPRFNDPTWFSKYEPKVAEAIIDSMIALEEEIMVIRDTRIEEIDGVVMNNRSIAEVRLQNGVCVKARVFIDASIEGHLLHLAGVSTETIREGNAKYGESLNGIQPDSDFKQFKAKVDPYLIPGDARSGLIETVQPESMGDHGDPSKYIMGFCFRMVLTKDPKNRLSISKPANYRPEAYEIYRRYLKAGGKLFKPVANRHNGKTDIGSWHDLSANLYGQNWRYPNGDYATQDSVVKYHREFTLGLIWFLQNDLDVDSVTRANWEGWGLPRDEFVDNDHWPRRLYIRSGRRMVSDYIITEHITRIDSPDTVSDPVAVAWWPPDMHHARRLIKNGYVYNEGFTHVGGTSHWKPFKISYKSMVPKKEECKNLLTPTCISSSYVGYGSIRILPTFMVLGQSSGAAAALVVTEDTSVQDLSFAKLGKLLERNGQILSLPSNWREVISQNNN